jgi:hypothetical protein
MSDLKKLDAITDAVLAYRPARKRKPQKRKKPPIDESSIAMDFAEEVTQKKKKRNR